MMTTQPEDQMEIDGGEVVSEEDRQAEEERAKEAAAQKEDLLEKLGVSLAKSRSAAMAAREASGIEDEWEEDEEHYEGIDDVNRGERRSWRGKPPGNTGQMSGAESQAQGSTIFLNITRPYVDAAAARVGDMLLPTDDRAWSLGPTPLPDLAGMAEGKFPEPILRQALAENGGNPDMAKQKLHAAVEEAVAQMKEAQTKADKAQTRIEDWHVQNQYHSHVRLVLEDATKIGCGVLKGPTPVKKRVTAFMEGALILKEDIQPGSFRVDPWNFYPDAACGENIHNGSHCWERDDISERGLQDLMGTPGYEDSQIEKVLLEGALKASRVAPDRPLPDGSTPDKTGMFEIWYYHGMLAKDDLEAIGCECPDDKYISVPAQVTMVNNRVIRAVMNPIDTGELPYDVMVWQKRTGHWAGIGVSRQIRTPQEIVVGAGRNLMDNAGRAGGPQLVVQQGVVVPHDGIYEVTPWKVWMAGPDADIEHVDKAFRFVTIPILQQELMAIIQLGLKLAEDVTGLPMLLQGQAGNAPDTLGGQQLATNNANGVLRRIARLFDDRVTEPHVRRYYTYLLTYGEDEEKGDFHIDARGSSALVQRDLENQAVGEMANMVANPIFGIDPKKWAAEWLKAKHLDVNRFTYDDDKWQEIVANMSKGEQDPRAAIAQLKAQTDEKLRQMDQAFQAAENNKDREMKMMIAQIDAELAKMGLTADQQKVLSEIKGRLGDTVIKLRAEREMQMADQGHQTRAQVMKPLLEPPGRAANGKAFVQ